MGCALRGHIFDRATTGYIDILSQLLKKNYLDLIEYIIMDSMSNNEKRACMRVSFQTNIERNV